MLAPITADQCALLIGIPLSFEEFSADTQSGTNKDFVTSILRNYPGQSIRNVWDGVAGPIARRVSEIIDEVGERGVYVKKRVTIPEVPPICERYQVVTLLTHWRSGQLFPEQILNLNKLRQKVSELKSVGGFDQFHRQLCNYAVEDFPVEFCRLANLLLETADLSPSTCPVAWHSSPNLTYRVHANRLVLDSIFADELAPGNRVEFSDGMYTSAEFLEHIPNTFDGILDLTVCNSVMIAEEIKQKNRHFTCLANESETGLGFRTEIYNEVIRVISEYPYEYSEAVRDIRIAMGKYVSRSRKE